jgi:hypothetical protein
MRKMGIVLAASALFAGAEPALASHVRPAGASPARFSLVPAFKRCVAPNSNHGAPLAFPSCRPPVPLSNFLTVGTPESNGAPAHSIGHVLLQVKMNAPEDVLATLTISDVRCKPATDAGVCSGVNDQDGPDYSGQIQATFVSRSTDHYNGPSLTEAATMVDIPFPINAPCANTASTATGGLCTVNTTLDTIVPGAFKDGQRQVWELAQAQVTDGGADGSAATADNTVFAVEGTFVP